MLFASDSKLTNTLCIYHHVYVLLFLFFMFNMFDITAEQLKTILDKLAPISSKMFVLVLLSLFYSVLCFVCVCVHFYAPIGQYLQRVKSNFIFYLFNYLFIYLFIYLLNLYDPCNWGQMKIKLIRSWQLFIQLS